MLDEQPDIVDRPGAVDLVECRGRRPLRRRRASSTPTARRCSTTSTCTSRPGETVALVGRTGSGKSTVARLLARFYDVTDGAVRVDGHDVRDLTLPSLRHHIGMVLDEPFLFSVSIRDNIAYGRPDAPFDEIDAAATRRRRRRLHPRAARGLRHRGRGARLHALGRPAPADRDRPHAAREPADPRARRRHLGDRRADRAADPRARCARS